MERVEGDPAVKPIPDRIRDMEDGMVDVYYGALHYFLKRYLDSTFRTVCTFTQKCTVVTTPSPDEQTTKVPSWFG